MLGLDLLGDPIAIASNDGYPADVAERREEYLHGGGYRKEPGKYAI